VKLPSVGLSLNASTSKDVRVSWIGHDKLPLSVRGINRVNTWVYRDRAWVGYCQCRLDGLNGLLLHCRDSMILSQNPA